MKGLLLLLVGLLAGANGVYYLMARRCPAPVARASPGTTRLVPGIVVPGIAVKVAPAATEPPAAGIAPGADIAPAARMPAALLPAPATSPPPVAVPAPASAADLLLPVAGIKPEQLTDTFNQARDSERQHQALDIMAARGTPVLAATNGTVVRLFNSKQGGLTIYEFDPAATHAYYYAHLDRYAPGLAEGMPLKRGDLIGYVGSTGNAAPDAPHLHFAIFVLGPEKRWWQGTAINPYPLLTTAR